MEICRVSPVCQTYVTYFMNIIIVGLYNFHARDLYLACILQIRKPSMKDSVTPLKLNSYRMIDLGFKPGTDQLQIHWIIIPYIRILNNTVLDSQSLLHWREAPFIHKSGIDSYSQQTTVSCLKPYRYHREKPPFPPEFILTPCQDTMLIILLVSSQKSYF